MNKKLKKAALLLVGLIAAVAALTGCSAKAYASQCAFIVGNGAGDARQVKDVLLPGQKVNKGDDDDYYIPCNARNYVITPDNDHGDRHTPVTAKTGPSENGSTPATPVKVWLSAYWTPNENRDVLKRFYNKVCRKYSCASTDAAADDSNQNFSTPGWNGMLRETFGPAMDRTGTTVMAKFGADIWNDASKWNGKGSVAEAFQTAFADELRQSMQSGSDNYLCGSSDGIANQNDCTPITFSVEKIEPVDPEIVTIYNAGVTLEQKSAQAAAAARANKARLDSATALYGSREQAGAALREQDAIAACAAAKTSCVIAVGGANVTSPAPR